MHDVQMETGQMAPLREVRPPCANIDEKDVVSPNTKDARKDCLGIDTNHNCSAQSRQTVPLPQLTPQKAATDE